LSFDAKTNSAATGHAELTKCIGRDDKLDKESSRLDRSAQLCNDWLRKTTSLPMSTQPQSPSDLADALFKALTGFRLSEKYKTIELLSNSSTKVDEARLRLLIRDALAKQYAPGREDWENDYRIRDTRSWLLSALARVSSDDVETITEVARHVTREVEADKWPRYWALEGLIFAQSKQTIDIARQVTNDEDEPLVSMLAYAYLASKEDRDALRKVRDCLEHSQDLGPVLRALRVVPLPFSVQRLCGLVAGGDHTNETYDAIVALGRLDSTSAFVSEAAQSLNSAITAMRGSPWKDGMRAAAITALGNLRVESSGPLLLDELTDDNPAIVREAARTMEKILGLTITVNRVVEAATRNGDPATVDAFARALRWMNRVAVAGELEVLMGSGPAAQQEISRSLLSELGGAAAFEKLRARTASMKQYEEMLERAEGRIRTLFEQTVLEAQKGFKLATAMDLIVFGLGIALIVTSGGMALFKTGDFAAWVGTGVTGILGVVYGLLVAKPRKQVGEAVDRLMNVKIIFLAYLRRLHQTDQAYARLLLDSEKITIDELKSYSDIIGSIMELTSKQLAEAAPTK
jgi:HEAT repeat protein